MFQVGQRVRVSEGLWYQQYFNQHKGMVGIVENARVDGCHVRWNGNRQSFWFANNWLVAEEEVFVNPFEGDTLRPVTRITMDQIEEIRDIGIAYTYTHQTPNPCAEVYLTDPVGTCVLPSFEEEYPMSLQKGDKVKPNSNHTDYERYKGQFTNSNGSIMEGIITDDQRVLSEWISVRWSDGKTYGYRHAMLLKVDEGDEIVEEVTRGRNQFKVGDKVAPNPDDYMYDDYLDQHKGNDGVVVEVDRSARNDYTSTNIHVKWSHGYKNVYNGSLLLLLDDVPSAPIDRSTIPMPFMIGERVCLNPDVDTFRENNSNVDGTAGTVMAYDSSDASEVKNWLKRSTTGRKNQVFMVKFDNGRILRIRYNKLLGVTAPMKTVTKYSFANGDHKYLLEGDSMSDIDYYVIQNSIRIKSKTIFDDAFREGLITQIKANI